MSYMREACNSPESMHLDLRHDEEVDEVEPVIIRDSKRQDVTNSGSGTRIECPLIIQSISAFIPAET
jgi:hypothetical protein